ncbi:hypothetical protein WR25_23450 [Diploscapter pachys]|uniref:Gamma-aminobutyric acid type B receptor subunit 2 n=1 Tax=Diploscapter pachys TaxID=2018661 RepID=A0A2A2KQE3_9BILA|nr:hypothetical protein WR25_23450 [Diploscapter pachys]
MKALFDLIAASPRPVAILGGVCTEVNEPVAMALKHWQIVQLSYAETHAKFSTSDSQELFLTFYRIVPGDRNLNNAKFRLIDYFKWKKIGTVKQNDDTRYALPHETLTTRLENAYLVTIAYTAGISLQEKDNIGRELQELKDRDVHIIVMDASPNMSAIVLCEAYHKQMYGDQYVWIIPGDHTTSWVNQESLNCTKEEMMKVLENHFITEFSLARKDNLTYIVGDKRQAVIWDELTRISPDNIFRGYLYDGLWTLAIALSKSLGADASFSYHKMLTAIDNTSFEGVTGRVRFENNERLGLVDVMQWKNGVYVDVGTFDGASDTFTMYNENLGDWKAPLDSTIVVRRGEYISLPLLIGMSLLALIGIALSLIFLVINIHYRNHRFIKMSSPNMNNIIIIGSMCTFASVILIGLDAHILSDSHFVKLCYIKSWTMCLGFTLAFGSMFSKTWRVHSIFTNIRMDKKAIKDSKLLMILAGLLALDIVVLLLWAIFSPFRHVITQLPQITLDNKVIIPEIGFCESTYSSVFQAILYVIKGVLMILGCFLAWETRHVNVPALNDSKFIGISVYVVVVMSVLGLSTSVILKERVNEAYALSSFFIIFSTSCTLCLVFGPKVKELSTNPQGTEPRAYRRGLMKSVVAKTSQTSSQGPSSDAEREAISKLEAENQLKKRSLHQKSTQLWDLLDKLREMGDTQFLQQG